MIKLAISTRGKSLIESPIRKFFPLMRQAEQRGIKVYKLNVGDPDIKAPAMLLGAIKNYAHKNIHYAPSSGIEEHVLAWVKYYQKLGIKVESGNLIPTVGAAEAIFMALLAVTNPGDEVLVFEPMYTSYRGFATLCGVKLVAVSLELKNNFRLESAGPILSKISSRSKAIVVINPDNPTGKVWQKREFDIIIKIAKKYGLYIVADETYREIVFEGKPDSLLRYSIIRDNLIVADSLSKRFSAPGIRIGAAVSYNSKIIEAILKMAMIRLSAPTLGQMATVEILQKSKSFTSGLKNEFKLRRDAVNRALSGVRGVVAHKPAGAFYQVVGLPVKDSEDFVKFMLTKFSYRRETVLVAPMENFYLTPGKGTNEIRIAYVIGVRQLKKAMEILKRGLREYLAQH